MCVLSATTSKGLFIAYFQHVSPGRPTGIGIAVLWNNRGRENSPEDARI